MERAGAIAAWHWGQYEQPHININWRRYRVHNINIKQYDTWEKNNCPKGKPWRLRRKWLEKTTTLHQELQRFGLEEISKGIFHKLRERHVMKHKSSKKTIKVREGNGKRGRRAKRYLGDWWNEWSVCKKTPPPH